MVVHDTNSVHHHSKYVYIYQVDKYLRQKIVGQTTFVTYS